MRSRSLAGAVLAALAVARMFAAAPDAAIKVDQAGYPREASKLAMVVAPEPAARFTVRSASVDLRNVPQPRN